MSEQAFEPPNKTQAQWPFDHRLALLLYANPDVPVSEIAKTLGTTTAEINTLVQLEDPALKRETRNGRRPAFDHAEALRLCEDPKVKIVDVATRMGVSKQALDQIIKAKAPHLIELRKQLAQQDYPTIVAEYRASDCTVAELARRWDLTTYKIKQALATDPTLVLRDGGCPPAFDHEEMIALYAAGEFNQTQLALRYGVSQSAIQGVLDRKAPHLKPGGKGLRRKLDRYAVTVFYRECGHVGKTAEHFGICDTTVRRTVGAVGVSLQGRKRFDHQKAIRLCQSGESVAEVAQRLGIANGSLRNMLRKKAPHLLPRVERAHPFDHAEAIRLYVVERMSMKQVAKRLGVRGEAIRAVLHAEVPHLVRAAGCIVSPS
jgi:transposase-like protein